MVFFLMNFLKFIENSLQKCYNLSRQERLTEKGERYVS